MNVWNNQSPNMDIKSPVYFLFLFFWLNQNQSTIWLELYEINLQQMLQFTINGIANVQ